MCVILRRRRRISYYASSWTTGENSGFVLSVPYRKVFDGYFAHASSKITICFVSAFYTLAHLLKKSGAVSSSRNAASNILSLGDDVALRNFVLDWFGDVLPIRLDAPLPNNDTLNAGNYSKKVEISARIH